MAFAKPNKELLLRNITSRITNLPTLPSVVNTIVKLTSDPETRIKDLAEVIRSDQSLAMKVLKMSNSAFYGFSRKVVAIETAVKILGFKTLKNLVLSVSAAALFGEKRNEEFEEKLWNHSLFTAVTAREFAMNTKYRMLAEEVYVGGLLHDIGKKIINDRFPYFYKRLAMLAAKKNVKEIAIENEALGFDHSDVGSYLAERWYLPVSLVEAIAHHHFPMLSERFQKYTYIIHIADILSKIVANYQLEPEELTNEDILQFYKTDVISMFELDNMNLFSLFQPIIDTFEEEKIMFEGTESENA